MRYQNVKKKIYSIKKNIFRELNIDFYNLIIYIDNKVAIYNCDNEAINSKSKQNDLKYHKIRELERNKIINLKYIKSGLNLADGFTKYFNGPLMSKFKII